MALSKKVKNGGVLFVGNALVVNSAKGDYVMAIIPSLTSNAVNGIAVTPSSAGVGDTFVLNHVDTTAVSGGILVKELIKDVNNIGGNHSLNFDFATLEMVKPGESLRFIYTNASSQAMDVHTITEVIR